MAKGNPNPLSNLKPFRLEALEDGVFAIAMTLLVLNLKVPERLDGSLLASLAALWPNALAYVGSFLVLGVFWFGHRAAMNYITRTDYAYHWLNIVMLMFVAVIPFTASLIAKYYAERTAVVVFGLNLIAIGMAMYAQWVYAVRGRRLVDPGLSAYVIRFAKIRMLFAPTAYAIAVGLSFIDTRISMVIFTVAPVLYILPFFQPLWRRIAGGA
jgi:uncharacterized membrane protein